MCKGVKLLSEYEYKKIEMFNIYINTVNTIITVNKNDKYT